LKVKELPSIPSRLRLGLTVIIALMMVSSTATVMLFNPGQVLAYSRVIENSNDHPNPPMSEEHSSPSVSSPAATTTTPTIQAPLQIPRTLQSNDLVNSLAFYEVTFITSTTGPIDKIRMDFPAGTNIAAAGVLERVGIGGGTLLKSGSSITYDVTTPLSIPAGTFIRLEMFGIKNPPQPFNFAAIITTRDSSGNLIDGPSQTNVYAMKQIESNDVAESFMKKVTLLDDAGGNALGWNPDGVTDVFNIQASTLSGSDNGYVNIMIPSFCGIDFVGEGLFLVSCEIPPTNDSQLHYLALNLPAHTNE
jgi:hypothetical protein